MDLLFFSKVKSLEIVSLSEVYESLGDSPQDMPCTLTPPVSLCSQQINSVLSSYLSEPPYSHLSGADSAQLTGRGNSYKRCKAFACQVGDSVTSSPATRGAVSLSPQFPPRA